MKICTSAYTCRHTYMEYKSVINCTEVGSSDEHRIRTSPLTLLLMNVWSQASYQTLLDLGDLIYKLNELYWFNSSFFHTENSMILLLKIFYYIKNHYTYLRSSITLACSFSSLISTIRFIIFLPLSSPGWLHDAPGLR